MPSSLAPWLPAGVRRFLTPTLWQTSVLFAINMVTNGLDYAFHFYLGWVLLPADFAIVQTVNSALLIVVTVFGMTQPMVARFVVERGDNQAAGRAIFQTFFWQSVGLGLAVTLLVMVGREAVGQVLNVPPLAVLVPAAMVGLALVRPVVAGMLQAQERFQAFGWTRTVFAVVRLGLVMLLMSVWRKSAAAALITLPLGALASLLAGLWVLGRAVWQKAPRPAPTVVWQGWRLSVGALVAYAVFMLLQSVDLIWVNRTFAAEDAAAFATVVLFRRLLAVLPGAVVVIMYPRAAALVARHQSPTRLLRLTALGITLPTLFLTLVYFVAGDTLIALSFGGKYPQAAALLGWMGVAMVGHGLGVMWLNFFLATRPQAFNGVMVVAAAGQILLLWQWGHSLLAVTVIFGLVGFVLALMGGVLYLLHRH